MSIIALFSSSRRYGNTGSLLDSVAGRFPMEIIDLDGKNISCFDYDHNNRGDDVEPLMDYVLDFARSSLRLPNIGIWSARR